MANETEQQEIYFDDQDVVAPDIRQLYNTFIKEIDLYRSHYNSSNVDFASIKSSDDLDKHITNASSYIVDFQESRCHAFYRLVGFPVIDLKNNMYSPGHDPNINRNKDEFQKRINILNDMSKVLLKMMADRENYFKNVLNIFQNKGAKSTAIAVASTIVRNFSDQLSNNEGPLLFLNQSFPSHRELVEQLFSDGTEETRDILKYKISNNSLLDFNNSTHILKPFIVDPRIELTVVPAKNRICAPFLSDKSETQLTGGRNPIKLNRPYIERIISTRFNNKNVTDTNGVDTYVSNIIASITEDSSVTNKDLVEINKGNLNQLYKSELTVFNKYIRIIRSLVVTLFDAQNEIKKTQRFFNWKPIIDPKGIESGITVNAIDINDPNNLDIEKQIINLENLSILKELNLDIGNEKTDVGSFVFSNIDDIVLSGTKEISTFTDNQLSELKSKRNERCSIANDALLDIEIITGEFSGLGLIDIYAILASLWIMKKEAIIGLVDANCIERMQKRNELKFDASTRLSVTDSLAEFEKKLSEVYNLIDKYYSDYVLGRHSAGKF